MILRFFINHTHLTDQIRDGGTMNPGNRQDDFWITVSFSSVWYPPQIAGIKTQPPKYFIGHFLKKKSPIEKISCIRNICCICEEHVLHMRSACVAYVKYMCCICKVHVLHMRHMLHMPNTCAAYAKYVAYAM